MVAAVDMLKTRNTFIKRNGIGPSQGKAENNESLLKCAERGEEELELINLLKKKM